MMAVAKLLVVVVSCLLMLTSTCCSSSHGPRFTKHTPLFIFGDSLFDPGNNDYINTTIALQANFTPYGISYFHPPTGRFSNGRLIPDFIAEFASLPLIPAYFNPKNREFSYGANFASGGSGALVETVTGFGIHKKGGRKFGILTTMPLACFPGIRVFQVGNTNCNQQLGILTSLHNQILSKKLEKLEKKLDGFKYAYFDISTAVSDRMKNPSKYGFKVGDSACCGSGPFRGINSCGGKRGIKEFELCDNINDYIFFDSIHPSEAANRQYAELFWNGGSNVTTPYNLKTLYFQGTKYKHWS